MKPITAKEVWSIIDRLQRPEFMSNPFFLMINCEYEDKGDDLIIRWKFDRKEILFATKNPKHLVNQEFFGYQSDLDRLKAQGLEMKEITPGAKEYFYRTADLAELKGNDYKRLRKEIRTFADNNKYTIVEEYPAEESRKFIADWFTNNKDRKGIADRRALKYETEIAAEMINMLRLVPQMKQMYVLVDGVLAGLSLYCPIYPDFWVSIIQKCDHRFTGLSRFMVHEKCKRMLAYPMASFGDDAEDKTLAAAKMKLRPAKVEQFYYVSAGGLK